MTDKIIVLTTCENSQDAQTIAETLVEKRLAACVNILPGLKSIYRWQGKVENAAELLLLIKTRRGLFEQLSAELARIHPYEVPEVIALPVIDGAPAYLGWLEKELKSDE
jgi:periplasmic divalent cation tolerance protein